MIRTVYMLIHVNKMIVAGTKSARPVPFGRALPALRQTGKMNI